MSENAALPLDQDVSRELPSQITIPPIKGEMVHLRPASVDDLPRMDELFFIDHRGVTVLSRCDGQPYMAIFAERIAGALRGLFPNM